MARESICAVTHELKIAKKMGIETAQALDGVEREWERQREVTAEPLGPV